ncbi:MAG TPA: YceI family protein [Pseudonocardiaceae bacterium]|jgi:polyisoprenoid-binding protein YceI|nr:YceI family protein [Pseudonocardiaceae bacterium]
MAVPARSHRIGPDQSHLLVYTFREGVAAGVGHDLELEIAGWSADITVGDDVRVEATVDLATLVVRKGVGGVKPLSDRDRREIAHTARGLLDTDHHPQARFTSTSVTRTDHGGTIVGDLTVRGVTKPFTLDVSSAGPDHNQGTDHYVGGGELSQGEFGIKKYTAFFGALKLADRIRISVDADLSGNGT